MSRRPSHEAAKKAKTRPKTIEKAAFFMFLSFKKEGESLDLSLFFRAFLNQNPSAPSEPTAPTKKKKMAETPASDEKIIALMSDPATLERGFRLLMAEHQERLYWHIRRIVGTHADADDVLQNTLVKAWRGFGGFEGKSKIYTWLYRIGTNEAITFLNQKQRKMSASIDDPASFVAARLRADEFFDGDAAQLHLQKAIAVLPEKQKQVFNLRYFDEMPYEEMSELLGTSVGALKASYHHAVKKVEAFFGSIQFA